MRANNEQTKHSVFFLLVYRSTVGRFYDTATLLFMHRGGKMKLGNIKMVMYVSSYMESYFIRFFYHCSSECARKTRFRFSGDIESKPGPVYVVKNIVQGSFHQFNQRFGSTSSIQ